jgi:hypothetical protein
MVTDHQIQILEKIVELKGDCLKADMCRDCPFAKQCLPEFLKVKRERPSKQERFNMALDKLTNISLFDDEDMNFKRA